MVSKCANPRCSVVFRYLREGKLFQIPGNISIVRNESDDVQEHRQPRSRDEFFWLCGVCSKEFTIVLESNGEVRTIPRQGARAVRAAS